MTNAESVTPNKTSQAVQKYLDERVVVSVQPRKQWKAICEKYKNYEGAIEDMRLSAIRPSNDGLCKVTLGFLEELLSFDPLSSSAQ